MAKRRLQSQLAALSNASTLELTTLGRKSGRPHTVTIWFLVDRETVYLVTLTLRRDWPRNILKNGNVELEVGGKVLKGHAERITDAPRLQHVNDLLRRKYWAAWLGSWFGAAPEGAFAVTLEA